MKYLLDEVEFARVKEIAFEHGKEAGGREERLRWIGVLEATGDPAEISKVVGLDAPAKDMIEGRFIAFVKKLLSGKEARPA